MTVSRSLLGLGLAMMGCTSRGYNQNSSPFAIVPQGGYVLDRLSVPGEDIVAAALRISPSKTQGLTSYSRRGWLTCTTSISGQASCFVRIERRDAMLANSAEIMKALNRRLLTPKKPNGESAFEWKISVPVEARMQRSNGEDNTYAVSFGSEDLGEETPAAPKQQENTFTANAIMGLRVEHTTVIPVMEKLKAKAKIPKGQSFLEADISCDNKKVCSLSAPESGGAEGSVVSEVIPDATGLLKGIETELGTYGSTQESKNADLLYQGRMRLFQEIESGKTDGKARRNTVALATFYTIEFLD